MTRKHTTPVPMVATTLNVVNWLNRLAYLDTIHLQPLALHRLLYLSQGHFAALNQGRAFIPAHFIATHKGPIEPNIYQVMINGMPKLDPPPDPPNDTAIAFLDVIWRKYSHHSADYLLKIISQDQAFVKTLQAYPNGIIPLALMGRTYRQGTEAGKVHVPERTTQTGKPLSDWSIRKTADQKNIINPNMTRTQKQRPLTAAEELALDLKTQADIKQSKHRQTRPTHPNKQADKTKKEQTRKSRASDPFTVARQLAEDLKAHQKMRHVKAPATQNHTSSISTSNAPAQPWQPAKAPYNARILRSDLQVNSAPGIGLPWRKTEET